MTPTTQHTPGPWSTATGRLGGLLIMGADDSMVTVIAPEDGAVGVANATLIAAAPDLLAALEALTGAYWDVDIDRLEDESRDEYNARLDEYSAVLKAGAAAIAKARGIEVAS